ncbi:MAG: hypothetical protein BWX73_03091 [Lentisphaerae bacterium ADurb.Bin082]|nr:MAG: hypothetical protein BWX73_03091 [Lentisphaerae bacterium ADurb.Bin082]
MSFKLFLSIAYFCSTLLLFAELAVVTIRFAEEAPFPEPKKFSPEWQKADVASGFVIPEKYRVETFPSEGAMLFDDTNLYILLTANMRKHFRAATMERDLASDNNFEVFLFPNVSEGTYYQIRVSQGGEFYMGKSEGNVDGAAGKRMKCELPGIQYSIKSDSYYWRAMITVPLASLSLKAPEEGKKEEILFNICRQNIDIPTKEPEASSFAVLDRLNYHQPSTWRKAVLDRTPVEKGTTHYSQSETARVNLIPNSGFDLAKNGRLAGWYYINPRDVERRETSEFSGQWVMYGFNNAYQLFTAETPSLREGQIYTLRIRARQRGGDNAIGVLPMLRTPEGKAVQGKRSIAWKLPLTDEFREYTFHFTAEKDQRYLSFYRFGEKVPASGAEYDSVELYEGKLSTFEIRKIGRIGNKSVIPGSAVKAVPNPFGKTRTGMKVLAVCEDQVALQVPYEVFAGVNAEVDTLTTTNKGADLYYTDSTPDAIQKRLESGEYDLYVTGRNIFCMGKGLAGLIAENVQNGAGLIAVNATDFGELSALVAEGVLAKNLKGTFAGEGGIFRFFRPRKLSAVTVEEKSIGKGRIILYPTGTSGWSSLDFIEAYDQDNMFPYENFVHAWIMRMCYYAAGKLQERFDSFIISGTRVDVTTLNVPDGTRLSYTLYAKDGSEAGAGETTIFANTATVAPELVMNGEHLLVLKLLGHDGLTMDYGMVAVTHETPGITHLEDVKKYNTGDVPAEIRFRCSEVKTSMKLSWTLRDFSGRILEKGELDAVNEATIKVPLSALFTNYSKFTLDVMENGEKIDTASIPVYVQDRDRKRFLSDFTPCVWPPNPSISKAATRALIRQLENIGILSLGFLYGDGTLMLSEGVGFASGASVGGGNTRFYIRKQESKIRKPEINSVKAREEIVEQTERAIREGRFVGAISCNLCDEPAFSPKNESDELDSHPDNIAEYRKRMKEQFDTIEKFNEICKSSYKSFDEIAPAFIADARKSRNFTEFILWRNYNTDRWCEVLKLMSDIAKKFDPGIRLSIPNTFGQGALGANDYWRLLTKSGLGFSQEYTSMVYMGGMENPSPIYDFDEFYRSFAPDMRVWGYIGYINSEARLLFQPWWFAAHQYGGFTWYSSYAPLIRHYGLGTSWSLVDVPGNGLTVDAVNLKKSLESSKLLKGTGKLLLEYPWAKRDIAVYYSHDSMLLSFCLGQETKEGEIDRESGPLHDYFYSRHRLRYLLEGMLHQYDFVAPEQITDGILAGFKILFMPGIKVLSDEEVASLKAFMKRGGIIVADFMPGEYDQFGRKRAATLFAGEDNLKVLGKCFDDTDMESAEKIKELLASAKAAPVMESDNSALCAGREGIRFMEGTNNLFMILRNPVRAKTSGLQTLAFPVFGHVYDIQRGKYLGTNSKVQVSLNDKEPVAFFGIYPYSVKALEVSMPEKVKAGSDLEAALAVVPSEGKAGKHVFHIEVIPPGKGVLRHHMMRNINAENGKASFRFRMGFNDPRGEWILLVNDILSGIAVEKKFILE